VFRVTYQVYCILFQTAAQIFIDIYLLYLKNFSYMSRQMKAIFREKSDKKEYIFDNEMSS